MKKYYTIFFLISMFVMSANAQKQVNFGNKPMSFNTNLTSVNQVKDIQANLNESFNVFPPASWTLEQTTDPWEGSATNSTISANASLFGDGVFAVFDAYNIDAAEEASLITPVLHPTAASHTLSYEVIEIYGGNPSYIADGMELYIEYSIDGGTSWTTSTTNVLAATPGHNTATAQQTVSTLTADLSAYNGGTVKVRFRAISDYGGFLLFLDNVTGPEADVTLSETDLVVTPVLQNYMTPLPHATYAFAAEVQNIGNPLASNATLTVSTSVGGFSEAITITTPFLTGYDSTFQTTGMYTASAVGNFTINYAAPLAIDPNPGDNSASQTVAVTDTVFATEDGVFTGAGGSNTAPLTFGNIYMLMQDDEATSVTVGFGTVSADLGFTASIYSVNPSTYAITLLYTTPSLTRTVAMSNSIVTFPIATQNLTAGVYFVAVDQLDATNIAVATTGSASGGGIYLISSGQLAYTGQLGNACIRLNVGTPTSANEVALNSNVTVYPNPANDVVYVSEIANITVINMLGQVVATANNANQINVSELNAGNYIVKVQNNNVNAVKNITIVK